MVVELKIIREDGKSIKITLDSYEIEKQKDLHDVNLLEDTYKSIIEQLKK